MVAFIAGAVLTAANLNSAFNALTIRTVTGTSDTLVLADNGGAVTYSNASPVSVAVPLFSSIAYATGTKIVLVNLGAGTVTVAGAVGVTVNGSPLTLAQNAGATLIKTATNTWSFLPFSSGSAAAVISSTTGSPTITTDAGAAVYRFTGDGTLVVGTAGKVRVLAVGAGGGGGPVISGESGAGGGGGWVSDTTLFLDAGTYTIKIGTAGAAGINSTFAPGGRGGDTYITLGDFNLSAPGGGGGASDTTVTNVVQMVGASGGGGNYAQKTGGASVFTSGGYAGGAGGASNTYYQGGGGGGVGGAGTAGNSASLTGAAGGLGKDSDILVSGTLVFYGGGGGAGKASNASATAGAGGSSSGGAGGANGAGNAGATYGGGGGGGGLTGANNGGAGAQGVLVVRVG